MLGVALDGGEGHFDQLGKKLNSVGFREIDVDILKHRTEIELKLIINWQIFVPQIRKESSRLKS